MLQVLISIQGLVLNDKPYFNEPGYKNTVNTPVGEKHSMAYNQTAFVLSCKTMLYSLRNPPKVITEPSFLAMVKRCPDYSSWRKRRFSVAMVTKLLIPVLEINCIDAYWVRISSYDT
uniref:UBC core domain-containing protein n=1 Tax=Aegilops tauschii subsp. strangulata TaxID=200361 RepID=A0A453EIS8_AEGTS